MDVYQPDLNAGANNLGYLPSLQINGRTPSKSSNGIDLHLFESWDSENGANFEYLENPDNRSSFFQDVEC